MNRPEDIAALEVVAKLIYESFDGAEAHPWVEHGNSLRQNAARHNARSALEKAGYPLPGKPLAFRVIGRLGKSEWQDANERDETGTLLEITIAEAAKLDNPDEISIEIAYSGKTPSSAQVAVAELVASIEHYFKNYMLDEADDDHVCNTDAQHNAAVRVRDAIEAMSAPHDEPLFTASMYGTAAVADKAREEWLAAKVEPQARHWREAIAREFYGPDADAGEIEDDFESVEQRARSLAQAEQGDGHASDCSVHNEPAYPNGPCDCGMTADQRKELEALEADCRNPETPLTFEDVADRIAATFTEVQWPRRRLSMTFTHDTCGDALFCRMCVVAAQEYFAADSGNGVVWAFVASNGVRVQITSHELLQWEKAQL